MYHLTRSAWYELEFAFCQTDTFPDSDAAVTAAHGVCSVCAKDWISSKYNGESFVFSKAAVAQKAVDTQKAASDGTGWYGLCDTKSPTMMTNNAKAITLDSSGGSAIGSLLDEFPCSVVRISQGHTAHMLAFAKKGGKYYMFDSNFGSFKCSYKKGVSSWYTNLLSCNRPNRGRYTDWANSAELVPYF